MGAIAGILSRIGEPEPDVARRMLAAAPHRGTEQTTLRLGAAVLGVGWAGETPDAWLAHDGGLAAAFVGILDNHAELAERWTGTARASVPQSPAALLLAVYRVHGEQTLRHLRGSFAAIITDGAHSLAFRDHLGIGTLFLREDPGGVLLASEAKQIVAGAQLPFEPDVDVLERLFYNLLDDGVPCALKGVARVPKASVVHIERQQPVRVERYWFPEALLETARVSPADLRERFDELMDRAVSRVLSGADAISLSGGIDSTAVAAFAGPAHRRLFNRPLPALTQVFPDHASVDELPYTAQTAEQLGLTLQTYTSSARQLDDLVSWVRLADGPPLTVLPEIAHHFRLARSFGFRTILTGEFGEFVYDMHGSLLTHLIARGRVAATWKLLGARPMRRSMWRAVLRDVLAAATPTPLAVGYRRFARRHGNPMLPDWIDPRLGNRAYFRHNADVPPRQMWREAQLAAFRGPWIGTESVEICGAMYGVRFRRPLADVDLWEFFLSLPAEVKFPDTLSKSLVRSWLRGRVPDLVLDRHDKTVFDEFALAQIDYVELERWLTDSSFRMPGVDYRRLTERLRGRDLLLSDAYWANDLAAVHAFVSLWN